MILLLLTLLSSQSIFSQEWHPSFYRPLENNQTPQMLYALKELSKLHLKGNESVLDVGCGNGAITAHIGHYLLPNGTIHGIDISESMINYATQQYTNAHISFECISLFDYKPTHLYDAVVCFWTLYLFDNYTQALNKIVTYLKPGGKALICHIIDPGTPFFQFFKKNIAPQQLPILPTLEKIIAAIKEAFISIHYLEVKYNYDHYTNLEELCATMKKIPYFNLIPKEKEKFFYTIGLAIPL